MQKSIAGKILRFHVLANSDSEADQNVKKQVRDAVGAYIEPYLLECENIEETRATVNDHMDEILRGKTSRRVTTTNWWPCTAIS